MNRKTRGWRVAIGALMIMGLAGAAPAWAQAPAPAPAPAEEKKAEEKPKTLWDEFKLFSYVEMGGTFNLHGVSRGVPGSTSTGSTNLLRYYDINEGYTFNMAEFSIKRDPDEKFPFGGGVVLTAGQDAQKNHSIGLLRSETDVFPFRNTPWFDLQEAYISARIPIGAGPVIKAGKFVTLLGSEVIESPSNLNYSRGYLFTLAIPLTSTGVLASYSFTDWLSVQGGVVLGWDRSDTENSGPSGTGQIAVTPIKDLPIALNFIVGPEKSGDKNPIRGVLDLTAAYTMGPVTLGLNFDYGAQANDVFLTSQDLGDKSSKWYGLAGYIAYDFLKDFRASVRQEWFRDPDGTRTATVDGVTLFSTTGTLQYNIWKGLYARAEYRHDSAREKVFGCRPDSACENKSQDTLSVSLYYKFF
jgi:Putative beta-barrel porin-2, OmpL-like. bbp2